MVAVVCCNGNKTRFVSYFPPKLTVKVIISRYSEININYATNKYQKSIGISLSSPFASTLDAMNL